MLRAPARASSAPRRRQCERSSMDRRQDGQIELSDAVPACAALEGDGMHACRDHRAPDDTGAQRELAGRHACSRFVSGIATELRADRRLEPGASEHQPDRSDGPARRAKPRAPASTRSGDITALRASSKLILDRLRARPPPRRTRSYQRVQSRQGAALRAFDDRRRTAARAGAARNGAAAALPA